MVDMAAISGLVTSLKAAGEISKAIVGLRDATLIQNKVIELNGIILSAQSSALAANTDQFALLEQVRQLEKQIADLEAWDTQKERYELKDVGSPDLRVFAYALKQEAQGAEPFHLLCAKCFEGRHRSILQATAQVRQRYRVHRCPECRTEYEFDYVPPKYVKADRRHNPFDW